MYFNWLTTQIALNKQTPVKRSFVKHFIGLIIKKSRETKGSMRREVW